MRRLFRFFLIISLVGAAIFASYKFVVPFIYKIKEPFFIMPIELKKAVLNAKGLPIRHDAYGDGEFGAKRKGGRVHRGLDLASKLKSAVFASKSGLAKSHFIKGGYGNLVVINHPGGWQTRYGHLDKIAIGKFQWVRQGEVIGTIGKTGNADVSGIVPHLHFEIRYKGKPIDPAKELLKRRLE